jgi:penicillin-binding protein 1B
VSALGLATLDRAGASHSNGGNGRIVKHLPFRSWVRAASARLPAGIRNRLTPRVLVRATLVTFVAGAVLIGLEAVVRARLDGSALNGPTRLYARPLVITPGMPLSADRLEEQLDRLGYREVRTRNVDRGEYRRSRDRWTIGRRPFRHYREIDAGGIVTIDLDSWGRVEDLRDGRGGSMPAAALEPELIGVLGRNEAEDQVPVGLDDVPSSLVDAVLAIEDQHFFEHSGFDVKRMAGAMLANLRARRVVQGASTLTQQLAKNLFLSARRTPLRKLREAAMALVLEVRYSKQQILEAYLNEIYLGQNGGLAIHGVGRAAQYYFGKDIGQLDLAEAALLAGIIRGPNLYAPFRNPEAAGARRDLVLGLMRERGAISERDYRRAVREKLALRRQPETSRRPRYFTDYVRDELREGGGRIERGAAVFTTLDPGLQKVAEDAVRDGLARLEREYPRLRRGNGPLQAALVALDPRTGEILAMVGGRSYGASQFNRATAARRQPGSAFKPVVALAALSETSGEARFTLASTLEDAPLVVQTAAGRWEPSNYDGRFRGDVTLRDALERSLNVPFARLGLAVGPERIVQTARSLGIESPLQPYPSIALGAFEVTPLEMARAFGVLAAQGYRADTRAVLGVLDGEGRLTTRPDPAGTRVSEPPETFLVTSALEGAVDRGTGRGLRSLGYWGPVAAKSGTSSEFRDAWFIGYTPSLAVAVWVGFDDGRSIGLSGSRAALPIFGRFLIGAVGSGGVEDFRIPPGVEWVEVDPRTGLRAGPGCSGEPEVFLSGTAPTESCAPDWWSTWATRGIRTALRSYVRPLLEDVRRELLRALEGREERQ